MSASGKIALSGLPRGELEALVERLLAENAALRGVVAELKAEVATLKGVKRRPKLKPSGMEQATGPAPAGTGRGGGAEAGKAERLTVDEERVVAAADVPAGSRFKGYGDLLVQDLVLRPHVVRLRRERWLAPDGRAVTAPMPAGVTGHFGPEVLRAGLSTAGWVSVDDTGAGHRHRNGVCTQLGNDHFAAFVTTVSKSRLNFLQVLRAGYADYVIDAEALAYMRQRSLAGPVIARLAEHPERHFADEAAWLRHLGRLDIAALTATPDPVRIATEGAVWGSIKAHGLLPDTVILSDDAGQFALDRHALCWAHAERLVHKLDTFTDRQHAAQQLVRALVWWFYADLKAYKRAPERRRLHELRARFDRIFRRRTGFATLDRLLARLHANKEGLLLVLERPEVPLHTNGSERDLRPQVVKRKISGGTRSEAGRACRDAFLGLLLTCAKLGVSFWDYLGHRLGVPGADAPYLPDLVRRRSAPA